MLHPHAPPTAHERQARGTFLATIESAKKAPAALNCSNNFCPSFSEVHRSLSFSMGDIQSGYESWYRKWFPVAIRDEGLAAKGSAKALLHCLLSLQDNLLLCNQINDGIGSASWHGADSFRLRFTAENLVSSLSCSASTWKVVVGRCRHAPMRLLWDAMTMSNPHSPPARPRHGGKDPWKPPPCAPFPERSKTRSSFTLRKDSRRVPSSKLSDA